MKKLIAILCVILLITGCSSTKDKIDNEKETNEYNNSSNLLQFTPPSDGEEIAIMTTNMGTIKIRFFPDEAPKAVENFITHSKNGYYNGLTFHRVIKDFMIQGGDPLGTGMGGESIWKEPFEYEFSSKLHHFKGALAMAHSEMPNSNGSQFYIVHASSFDERLIPEMEKAGEEYFPKEVIEKYKEVGGCPYLDYGYTVFGQVIEGLDVVDKIASVETVVEGDMKDKPKEDVIIEKIEIVKYKK